MPRPGMPAPSWRAGVSSGKFPLTCSLFSALLFLLFLHSQPWQQSVEASLATRRNGGESRGEEKSGNERNEQPSERENGFVTLEEAEKGGRQAFIPSDYTPENLRISPEGAVRFMFGSCNLQPIGGEWQVDEEDRHMWNFIASRKPDLFALLGDNVYAHNFRHFGLANSIRWDWNNLSWSEFRRRRAEVTQAFRRPATIDEMREAFQNQTSHRAYQDFLHTGVHVIGTYDDHDLGEDNPSKHHPFKYEARDIVLDFFNVPKNSPRRSVFWDGAYSSHKIQVDAGFAFRVILLDSRFNRDSWALLPHGDILGHQQWTWLEEELRKSKEEGDAVTFIASSIQVLPSPFIATEAWSIFPDARRRLLNLIMDSGVQMPVLLSGDVHFAEINRVLCRPRFSVSPAGSEPRPAPAGEETQAPTSSPVSAAQCLAPSPWQRMGLLLGRLDREREREARHHGERRRAAEAEDRGGNQASVPRNARQGELGVPEHASDPSALFSQGSVAQGPRDSLLSVTPWTRPGLFERLFPSLSFLSSYVFMHLFAPSVAATFSLFSAPHPVEEYLDLLREGHAEERRRSEGSGAEARRDWRRGVELIEVTSSGLTHGVEETFLAAAAPARLAEYGLQKLLPRTSTTRDDFYGERLVYTRRNVGDIQLVRSPLFLLREGEAAEPGAARRERREQGEAKRAGETEDRAAYASLLAAVSSSCGKGGERDAERLSPSLVDAVGDFFAKSPARFHLLLSLYRRLLAVHSRSRHEGRGTGQAKTKLNISPRKSWGACSQGSATPRRRPQREWDEEVGLQSSVWCWGDEEQEPSGAASDVVEYGNRPTFPYPLLRNHAFFSLLLTVEALLHVSLQRLSRTSSSSVSSSSVSSSWTDDIAAFCVSSRSRAREAVGGVLRFLLGRQKADFSERDAAHALRQRRLARLLSWASALRSESRQICSALATVLPEKAPGDPGQNNTASTHGEKDDSRMRAQREKAVLEALTHAVCSVDGRGEPGETEGHGEESERDSRHVACGHVEEVLAARLWISVEIFALPFGDLVLETFVSPFAFQGARRRLLRQLEEESSDAREERRGEKGAASAGDGAALSGAAKARRGEETGRSERHQLRDLPRARWFCEPPEGPDRTPAYVAAAVLVLFLVLVLFCALLLRALACCARCVCGRRQEKVERRGGNRGAETAVREAAEELKRGSRDASTNPRRRRMA
ncbi:conserved hypothetical protein [Neospora caninum Liverpool]|uniref:PhoD-like phosphatase metallophosphatase domain-containing protein n=1 Tax=Neospora caninum (strain Liverpool) TaxID=572307 RepID=F0V948_NEOCL|nr:conserved hypothetical protein [Neospora caninum Liverpool]CBZ50273.1 conserved hypothetical protein [Neospora caninum Liverpool]CEL64877.1 TPA: hypothetical protein BN1204_007470 [Neospora caninum Liverpool]|eukprot:XP_003880307.1 conserved hypothetical protein [Neospora caninum Liverpool]